MGKASDWACLSPSFADYRCQAETFVGRLDGKVL
jgi:hypothetical protein